MRRFVCLAILALGASSARGLTLAEAAKKVSLAEAAGRLGVEPGAERWEIARGYRFSVIQIVTDRQLPPEKRAEMFARAFEAYARMAFVRRFRSEKMVHSVNIYTLRPYVQLLRGKDAFNFIFDDPDLRENLLTQFDPILIHMRRPLKLDKDFMDLIDMIGQLRHPRAIRFLRDAYAFIYAGLKVLDAGPVSSQDQMVIDSLARRIGDFQGGEDLEGRARYQILTESEEVLRKLADYGLRVPRETRNPEVWAEAAKFGELVQKLQQNDAYTRMAAVKGRALKWRNKMNECVAYLYSKAPLQFTSPIK